MPSLVTEKETTEESGAAEIPAPPSVRKHNASGIDLDAKWLETDGLGGFACAPVSGILSHRSQGLVVASKNPPMERYVLVNGLEVSVTTPTGEIPIIRRTRADEKPGDGDGNNLRAFESRPWPKWRYAIDDEMTLEHEFFVRKGMPVFVLTWKLTTATPGMMLRVRPLLSGRRLDQLQGHTPAFRFEPEEELRRFTWQMNDEAPSLTIMSNGAYRHDPAWFDGIFYKEDVSGGKQASEELASPGEFAWDLSAGKAHLIFDVNRSLEAHRFPTGDPIGSARTLRNGESMRRKLFPNPLQQIADHYVVKRTRDKSLHIMASYPLGSQCASDTLVALRGICLSSGRFEVAERILMSVRNDFAGGMLPSLLSEYASAELATFDSPDPALWFILAASEFLEQAREQKFEVREKVRIELQGAILETLAKLENGNNYGMYVGEDGLLAFYPPFSSHTKASGRLYNVATQALWLNAVSIGGRFERHWKSVFSHASRAFVDKYWFEQGGYLCDSMDPQTGNVLKARQILAVGGLPQTLVDDFRCNLVLQLIEDQLWTPYGLRIQRSGSPETTPVCSWLLGPFIEAWFKAHRDEEDVLDRLQQRYIAPWRSLLNQNGLDHIGESSSDPNSPDVPFYGPATAELLRILNSPLFARDGIPLLQRL